MCQQQFNARAVDSTRILQARSAIPSDLWLWMLFTFPRILRTPNVWASLAFQSENSTIPVDQKRKRKLGTPNIIYVPNQISFLSGKSTQFWVLIVDWMSSSSENVFLRHTLRKNKLSWLLECEKSQLSYRGTPNSRSLIVFDNARDCYTALLYVVVFTGQPEPA